MRELLDRAAADPQARMAIDLFCYTARKNIGALAAVLGGVDTLVFTGGIGERAAAVREAICAELAYLGVTLDAEHNAANASIISRAAGAVTVRVLPTDEDLVIARHTARIVSRKE
jgi:acetate kinase